MLPVWFAVTCLIAFVQVSGAFEAKPCEGFKGKVNVFEIDNCQNKTADYCEIKQNDVLLFDMWYKSGISYTSAWLGIAFGSLEEDADLCKAQPGFCPGNEGDEHNDRYRLSLSVPPPAGVVKSMRLFIKEQHHVSGNYIFCVEFPTKFVN